MKSFSLHKELEELLSYQYCSDSDKNLIKAVYTPGQGNLVIFTGDNASGKSFLARLLSGRAKKIHDFEPIRVGMELRTQPGIIRSFVFGDESWESTGMISLGAVLGGIRTAQSRTNSHCLIFDEPDIGLSEGYQAAMGKLLAEFVEKLPESTKICGIVTHSRRLVKQLIRLKPHFVRVGDTMSLEEFMGEPADKSIEDVKALQETALERFRALTRLIDAQKAKNKP